MSAFEEQVADQLSGGVDTDAAYRQTATNLADSGSSGVTTNDGLTEQSAQSQPTKKPRKPRQSKKADPVAIATQLQRELFLARRVALKKIKKRFLLPDDYEEAFWALHAATTAALQQTVKISGEQISHLLDIQELQAELLRDDKAGDQ